MNKDVISGLALLVFDAAYFWAAQKIPHSALDDAFGARGLPHILAVLLAVLAVVIAVRGFLAARQSQPAAAAEQTEDADHEAPLGRALGLLLIGAAYVVTLPILGYPIAIALLIGTIALYEGAARDWRVPAIAVFGGVLFWLLFNVLLGVGQPAGFLF